MTNTLQFSPEKFRSLERIERLSRLTQNVNEWVLHYHHKDKEFCDLFELMADCIDLAFIHAETDILPFTEDDLGDPAARQVRINNLLNTQP